MDSPQECCDIEQSSPINGRVAALFSCHSGGTGVRVFLVSVFV